jgi:predicted metal-dependent phosphotriesterase family hydrolase
MGQASHTHWEPYKNSSTAPSVDQKLADRVLDAMRAIGSDSFFVASDSGLVGTPNHTDALVMAARVLRQNGFDERALDVMFKENPARLLGLPPPRKND